jgi:hypothetical protein
MLLPILPLQALLRQVNHGEIEKYGLPYIPPLRDLYVLEKKAGQSWIDRMDGWKGSLLPKEVLPR